MDKKKNKYKKLRPYRHSQITTPPSQITTPLAPGRCDPLLMVRTSWSCPLWPCVAFSPSSPATVPVPFLQSLTAAPVPLASSFCSSGAASGRSKLIKPHCR